MTYSLNATHGDSHYAINCSWGIGAKVANDSMRSAAATLAEYASKGGEEDTDG